MGIAENKAVVARYFEAAGSGDLMQAHGLLSEDASWVVPGDWEMAGTYRGEAIRDMMAALSQFQGGIHFQHRSITAEDDRVVVDTSVSGDLADGRHYTNEIVFIFVIRDGFIHQITEAVDSAKSRSFWLGK